MPSPLPSTFASAAAGNIHDAPSGLRRGDSASGEWSRNRSNGATQTFRRPSVATNPSHSRDSFQSSSATSTPTATTPGAYVPPHLASSYLQSSSGSSRGVGGGGGQDFRYSKEQLLSILKDHREMRDVSELFVADWNPRGESAATNGNWTKRHDFKDYHAGAEICWDHTGQNRPLALMDLTEEEKDLFSSSVNSPIKPPPQSGAKDSTTGGGQSARKGSISHAQSHLGNFSASSPSSARPGARRRGTNESGGTTMSPTGNRFSREEPNTSAPPPSLLRRKTDFRDGISDAKLSEDSKGKERDTSVNTPSAIDPLGTLKRSITNPLSGTTAGAMSAWTPVSQSPSQGSGAGGFSSMGGAFGNFSLGPISQGGGIGGTAEKKTSFGSLRGESRFKNLLSKNSSEDIGSPIREKPSGIAGLDRLSETDDDGSASRPQLSRQLSQTRPTRSDTNPFDESLGTGSAPPSTAAMGGIDQFGLSSFGIPSTANATSGLRDFMSASQPHSRHEPMSPTNTNPYQSPHGDQQIDAEDIDTDGSDIHAVHLPNIGDLREDAGPVSLGYMQRSTGLEQGSVGDRSQTSSSIEVGRGFPSLGGLGSLALSSPSGGGGWPATVTSATGTPSRGGSAFPSTAFGDPIFGTMADIQSPSLPTLGGGFFGSHTSGFPGTSTSTTSTARPSKLGSLFPSAMQDQMRNSEQLSRQEPSANEVDGRQQPQQPQESLSEDKLLGLHAPFSGAASSSQGQTPAAPGLSSMSVSQPLSDLSGAQASIIHAIPPDSANNSLPTTQQRQMVMPDRMRWMYRDPQGNIQGPWSGLEMHDWFKAGFFTADLQVKKVEDTEYEPLAQLVRRIGNSREPFLVPQIGVPYGPPQTSWPNSGPNGGVQPPFPSSFPSFGTTLTAEQQNALERRKQEEQYLMARQKEHLAQQQAMMKQMQMQTAATAVAPPPGPPLIHPQQLQHHPSAHSLHSQPSYGSITSPGGFQAPPPPLQAPIQPPPPPQAMPGFFDTPIRQNTMPNLTTQMHPQDPLAAASASASGQDGSLPALLDRLNINRSAQFPYGTAGAGAAGQPESAFHSQAVNSILQERARLQQEQVEYDRAHQQHDSIFDQQAREERLRQFHALRGSTDEEVPVRRVDGLAPVQQQQQVLHKNDILQPAESVTAQQANTDAATDQQAAALSLSQQVQQAASAQRQAQHQQQQQQVQAQSHTQAAAAAAIAAVGHTESPWKVESGLPQPFPPPPPSVSPLPAPAAQRNRQHVADALAAAGSVSESHTPPIEAAHPTSVAPWAKDASEAPKGPSLREIQEAEARQAAKLEEVTAAARRALAEQERANQPPPPVPGLPSSANWASPGNGAGSVWMKPLAGKTGPASTTTPTVPKKTLAQIQKEEEARKARQQAIAAVAASNAHTPVSTTTTLSSIGKRYADLAGKVTPPSSTASVASTGAWTTVGAGGKPKPGPPAPPAPQRAASVTASMTIAAATAKPRPVAAITRSATMGGPASSSPNRATEELAKWAKMSLGRGLNSSINVDDFVQQLLLLPPETEIISDSVYANSQTLDGRRFAEEFIRRRKLADKGIVDSATANPGSFGPPAAATPKSDGWNEVAKKGQSTTTGGAATAAGGRAEDSSNDAFKVVAPKKKGKR